MKYDPTTMTRPKEMNAAFIHVWRGEQSCGPHEVLPKSLIEFLNQLYEGVHTREANNCPAKYAKVIQYMIGP
jgi:hypothetical protein